MAKKRKPAKKTETSVPKKYRPARNLLDAKKKSIDASLESAISIFERLPDAGFEERRVKGRILRAMRQDFIGSFTDLRQHMPLTVSEIRFVDRALKTLKNNYSKEGLNDILRLTCTLSGKPHKEFRRKPKKAVRGLAGS